MRILFLTNYYPPYEVGGYEQLCRDIAVRLEALGHTVAVLTSKHGLMRGEETNEPGVYRLLRIQPQYDTHLSPAIQFFMTRRQTELHNRRISRLMIEEFQPHVVFVWNLEGLPYELATDAESREDIAVAYWLAHYSPAQPDCFWRYWTQPPGKRVFLDGLKSVLRRFALAQMRCEGKPVRPDMHHVAVVSEWMRRKGFVEKTLPANTEVICNGVETDDFFRPVPLLDSPAPTRLLLAGRVSPDKGIHVAVEAIGKLAQIRQQRDFRLVIAGSGPSDYQHRLRRLAATYGVEELLLFLGWLPRDEMPDVMHSCHILLLTAIYPEAFSRVVLEGMAAGLTVVGTLNGGTGELLKDGVNGLAFSAEDPQELTRQIDRLLDNPSLRYRLATRGQETVLEQYTLERMVERVEDLLKRAVAEQKVLS
jgi:glycosyltransferase involved in cell wall biosynthesis